MKKTALGVFLLLFLAAAAPAVFAEKFQSSFSQDYLTQNNNQDLKQQMPSTTATPTTPTPVSAQPAIEKIPMSIPAPVTAPTAQTPLATPTIIPLQKNMQAPVQKGFIDIVKPKITVPDYEKRYKEIFLAQAEKAAKKRKKLIESIMDEVTKYGIYLIFSFVILLILYVLRKEGPAGPTAGKPPIEEDRKDIWKEDF